MTFPYDDDPEGQNEPDGHADTKVTLSRAQINKLEKNAREMKARAEKAERSLAFATAGIKLDDPKNKYFVNGYDGEIKPEDIKKAALEAGFLAEEKPVEEKPEEKPAEQQLTPEQAAQQQQLQMEQQAFGPIAQATQQQDTSGRNMRAEMEKVFRDGGDSYALADWMRANGLGVAEDQ